MKNKVSLILCGPSAVGKTTVMKEIVRRNPSFELVRSATTRAPRGDGHDSEYIYLSRDEFLREVELSRMLEHTEYGDNYYGTPISEIERIESKGNIPILILDINGVVSVKEKPDMLRAFAVYIYDELNILEQRLYQRELAKNPTETALLTFVKRKSNNIKDYLRLPEVSHCFDFFVRSISPELSEKEITEAYKSFTENNTPKKQDASMIIEGIYNSAKEKI